MNGKKKIIITTAAIIIISVAIAIIVLVVTSNKNDSTTISEETAQDETVLENFNVSWKFFATDEADTTTFYVTAPNAPTLFKNEEKIATMHDDGLDGDEVAEDGIYSVTINIESPTESRDFYSSGYNFPETNSIIIYINDVPSDEEIEIFETETNLMDTLDDSLTDSNGYVKNTNKQKAIDTVAEYAEKLVQNGVVAEYSANEDCVDIIFTSGLSYIYLPKIEDTLSSGSSEGFKVITYEPFSTMNYPKTVDESAKVLENEFKFITFEDDYDSEEIYDLSTITKNFGENKIIIWVGHGCWNEEHHSAIVIGPAEEIDYSQIDIRTGALVKLPDGSLAFTGKYILHHCVDLSNSVFYFCTCHSAHDKFLAYSFLIKGAKAFVGNTDVVYTKRIINYESEFMYQLTQLDNTTNKYHTLQEALELSNEKYGRYETEVEADNSPSEVIIVGDANFSFTDNELNYTMDQAAGNYEYASGANGWGTELKLNSDGTFSAQYQYSTYSSGTLGDNSYVGIKEESESSGKFKIIEKINDYSYKLELVDYKSNAGEYDYVDAVDSGLGMRITATETEGLSGRSSFILYTPETPRSAINYSGAVGLNLVGNWAICPSNETLAFIKH